MWAGRSPTARNARCKSRSAGASPPQTFPGAKNKARRHLELAERLAHVTALPIRRVPLDELERRFGRSVREAFDFSARVGTVHQALHAGYQMDHHDLDADLEALLRSA